MRNFITVVSAVFLILSTNPTFGRFLGDLNPTGKDGWVQKGIDEGKRVEKRVEKQINRTDEDLNNIVKKIGKTTEEAVRDTRDEVARYFRRNRQELEEAVKNGDLQIIEDGSVLVRLWNLQEEKDEIYGRPIDGQGIARKDLWIFDKNDFISYRISENGTVISPF